MRRRRRLGAEEAALWAKVVETATPLWPEGAPVPPEPAAPQTATRAILPPLIPPPPVPGGVTLDLRPSAAERLAAQRLDMDRRKFGKLRRGKLQPEARLDLHGMTQAEAHEDLTGFILFSHRMGRRLVLVITGKGRGEGQGGILRQQVPHWLSLPPLRAVVQQVAEAHRTHGGGGALYVYLRKNREDQ